MHPLSNFWVALITVAAVAIFFAFLEWLAKEIARCPMGSHLKLEDAPELARKALATQPEEEAK